MESIFAVYADGAILEVDLHSGAVLRQVQGLQGSFHLGPAQVATWPSSIASPASSLSPSTALLLQNRNSSKAQFWSCFDGGTSFEIRTPAVKFGGNGKVSSIASSSCGRYLLRGLQSGAILITEIAPPATQAIRSKTASSESSETKLAPIEIAQQGGASSLYWSHNLVQTSHLGSINSISCNENGMVAIASEDQTVSVVHLSALLAQIPQQTPLCAQISSSMHLSTSADTYIVPMVKLHEHTQSIVQLKICNDGRVFSISKDHTLKISDSVSQTRIASFSFPSALTCFCMSPNEEVLYAGSAEGTIFKLNLWDLVTRSSSASTNGSSSLSNIAGANYDWSSSISSSLAEWASSENVMSDPSGSAAKTGSSSSDIEPNAYHGHTQPVSAVSISLDGSRVVSSAMDGTVVVWDERTCQVIHRVSPIKGVGVAWSHIVCRPTASMSASASKFRLDATKKEKSSLPFALVQKPLAATGAPSGVITIQMGAASSAVPSITHQKTSSLDAGPHSFIDIDFNDILSRMAEPSSSAAQEAEILNLGLSIADRLQESHSSETENLKEEVARLTALSEKWKDVNNKLFAATLSSTLK